MKKSKRKLTISNHARKGEDVVEILDSDEEQDGTNKIMLMQPIVMQKIFMQRIVIPPILMTNNYTYQVPNQGLQLDSEQLNQKFNNSRVKPTKFEEDEIVSIGSSSDSESSDSDRELMQLANESSNSLPINSSNDGRLFPDSRQSDYEIKVQYLLEKARKRVQNNVSADTELEGICYIPDQTKHRLPSEELEEFCYVSEDITLQTTSSAGDSPTKIESAPLSARRIEKPLRDEGCSTACDSLEELGDVPVQGERGSCSIGNIPKRLKIPLKSAETTENLEAKRNHRHSGSTKSTADPQHDDGSVSLGMHSDAHNLETSFDPFTSHPESSTNISDSADQIESVDQSQLDEESMKSYCDSLEIQNGNQDQESSSSSVTSRSESPNGINHSAAIKVSAGGIVKLEDTDEDHHSPAESIEKLIDDGSSEYKCVSRVTQIDNPDQESSSSSVMSRSEPPTGMSHSTDLKVSARSTVRLEDTEEGLHHHIPTESIENDDSCMEYNSKSPVTLDDTPVQDSSSSSVTNRSESPTKIQKTADMIESSECLEQLEGSNEFQHRSSLTKAIHKSQVDDDSMESNGEFPSVQNDNRRLESPTKVYYTTDLSESAVSIDKLESTKGAQHRPGSNESIEKSQVDEDSMEFNCESPMTQNDNPDQESSSVTSRLKSATGITHSDDLTVAAGSDVKLKDAKEDLHHLSLTESIEKSIDDGIIEVKSESPVKQDDNPDQDCSSSSVTSRSGSPTEIQDTADLTDSAESTEQLENLKKYQHPSLTEAIQKSQFVDDSMESNCEFPSVQNDNRDQETSSSFVTTHSESTSRISNAAGTMKSTGSIEKMDGGKNHHSGSSESIELPQLDEESMESVCEFRVTQIDNPDQELCSSSVTSRSGIPAEIPHSADLTESTGRILKLEGTKEDLHHHIPTESIVKLDDDDSWVSDCDSPVTINDEQDQESSSSSVTSGSGTLTETPDNADLTESAKHGEKLEATMDLHCDPTESIEKSQVHDDNVESNYVSLQTRRDNSDEGSSSSSVTSRSGSPTQISDSDDLTVKERLGNRTRTHPSCRSELGIGKSSQKEIKSEIIVDCVLRRNNCSPEGSEALGAPMRCSAQETTGILHVPSKNIYESINRSPHSEQHDSIYEESGDDCKNQHISLIFPGNVEEQGKRDCFLSEMPTCESLGTNEEDTTSNAIQDLVEDCAVNEGSWDKKNTLPLEPERQLLQSTENMKAASGVVNDTSNILKILDKCLPMVDACLLENFPGSHGESLPSSVVMNADFPTAPASSEILRHTVEESGELGDTGLAADLPVKYASESSQLQHFATVNPVTNSDETSSPGPGVELICDGFFTETDEPLILPNQGDDLNDGRDTDVNTRSKVLSSTQLESINPSTVEIRKIGLVEKVSLVQPLPDVSVTMIPLTTEDAKRSQNATARETNQTTNSASRVCSKVNDLLFDEEFERNENVTPVKRNSGEKIVLPELRVPVWSKFSELTFDEEFETSNNLTPLKKIGVGSSLTISRVNSDGASELLFDEEFEPCNNSSPIRKQRGSKVRAPSPQLHRVTSIGIVNELVIDENDEAPLNATFDSMECIDELPVSINSSMGCVVISSDEESDTPPHNYNSALVDTNSAKSVESPNSSLQNDSRMDLKRRIGRTSKRALVTSSLKMLGKYKGRNQTLKQNTFLSPVLEENDLIHLSDDEPADSPPRKISKISTCEEETQNPLELSRMVAGSTDRLRCGKENNHDHSNDISSSHCAPIELDENNLDDVSESDPIGCKSQKTLLSQTSIGTIDVTQPANNVIELTDSDSDNPSNGGTSKTSTSRRHSGVERPSGVSNQSIKNPESLEALKNDVRPVFKPNPSPPKLLSVKGRNFIKLYSKQLVEIAENISSVKKTSSPISKTSHPTSGDKGNASSVRLIPRQLLNFTQKGSTFTTETQNQNSAVPATASVVGPSSYKRSANSPIIVDSFGVNSQTSGSRKLFTSLLSKSPLSTRPSSNSSKPSVALTNTPSGCERPPNEPKIIRYRSVKQIDSGPTLKLGRLASTRALPLKINALEAVSGDREETRNRQGHVGSGRLLKPNPSSQRLESCLKNRLPKDVASIPRPTLIAVKTNCSPYPIDLRELDDSDSDYDDDTSPDFIPPKFLMAKPRRNRTQATSSATNPPVRGGPARKRGRPLKTKKVS
ncbi:hypothetical protein GE061_011546 [Apolygus lucorum]|uniref:Uncharacterized protein n=1 Tax=Apolygus lucorum TaxID=248454 RepID=A0A8S9XYZ5_APOLU|nr:hypothetical protein GE061_011546 [Apolygus lucorum]